MILAKTGPSRGLAPFALGALLLVLTVGLAPGRSWAQLFTDTESRKAIAAQRETIAAQQQQIADLARQNEQLSGRLAQLENALKSQSLLELLNQVEALQADVRRLRGQQEVLGNGVETATRRQRDMYIDLDSRLKRVEVPGAPAAPAGAQVPGSAATAAAGTVSAPAGAMSPATPASASGTASAGGTGPGLTPGAPAVAGAAAASSGPIVVPPGAAGPMQGARTAASSVPAVPAAPAAQAAPAAAPTLAPAGETAAEQRSYDSAQELRRIGNYAGAITAFQAFIKTSPKSRLAPAAQYWIGDSHFNLREFRMAIAAQRQLIAGWPDNEKVPDALLNIASSQSELGDAPAARKTMEDLVARYPLSDAAERAKRRLSARK